MPQKPDPAIAIAIIDALKTGDADTAFELLVEHFTQLIARAARRFGVRPCDRPDFIQQVLYKIYAQQRRLFPPALPRPDALGGWIYVIAKRLALDIAREDDRVQPQEIDDRPDDRRSPEDAAILREYAEQLETFLSELKPEWSKAFILHALENMTEVEIAKVLGVSRRQARRYLDKVSARLKKTFGRKLP